jgi:hypothetical protein
MESGISGDAVLKTEKTQGQLADCNVGHSVNASSPAAFSDGPSIRPDKPRSGFQPRSMVSDPLSWRQWGGYRQFSLHETPMHAEPFLQVAWRIVPASFRRIRIELNGVSQWDTAPQECIPT